MLYRGGWRNALRLYPWRSLQQVVFDGVVGDVGIRLHRHLLQDPCAISADGLHAQEQFRRDFRHTLTLGELAEDLELALRQHAVPWLAGCALQATDEHLGELWADIASAPHRRPDGAAQLAVIRILAQKPAGSGSQHVQPV